MFTANIFHTLCFLILSCLKMQQHSNKARNIEISMLLFKDQIFKKKTQKTFKLLEG